MLVPLDPPPAPSEVPARLPDPFAGEPHPLARRAAASLLEQLRRGDLSAGIDLAELDERHGGKMFGVLVVRDEGGRLGSVRAFSGTLGGRWLVPGFAPPLFDPGARDAFWPAGEAALDALEARLRAPGLDGERRAALRRQQVELSHDLWRRILDLYEIPNARGERRSLRELFAPAPPPAGAADCAAPKLLAHAYRHGLRPLALAEFWWGAVPGAGDRRPGQFYPACADKCGGILPYMLEGL